jgi:2-oxoglutarate ferredoxin oxidoreductase subunit alpha
VQLAFHLAATWRNPVLVFGDYYLAHTAQSVEIVPSDFGPRPAQDWALDGSTGGSGHARLISPLGASKRRDEVGYDLSVHYRACAAATAEMLSSVTPMVEVDVPEGSEVVVVAFGTPARYVRAAVRAVRADGGPVGFVRPISLVPFPSAAVSTAAEGVRVVAVYENNQGQMIDDVRLSVLGRAPVEFIGGLSLDHSGFGIAPDLDVGVLRGRIEALL